MPLAVEHPDAALPTRNKYGRFFSDAAQFFRFGDSLGDFVSTGLTAHDQFTSVLDGDPVIKRFRNMTINAGHVVTPTLRCKGMYLMIDGDLTLNGSLSMSGRGCKGAGQFIGVDPAFESIYFNPDDIFGDLIFKIGPYGGAYTAYPANNSQVTGNPGVNNACGGGGSGGRHLNSAGGNAGRGARGTSFSGGAGGGGLSLLGTTVSAGDGADLGGAGGAGRSYDSTGWIKDAGGGAGNNGGAGYSYNGGTGYTGGAGTGGLLILIVKGNIIFGASGLISAKGAPGGAATSSSQNARAWGAGGGGAGGGAIHIFKNKDVTVDSAKLTAAGGAGGSSNVSGGAGGVGSITINNL